MTGSDPAIETRGLGKRYGRGAAAVQALRGLDLDVPRGAVVGLLGPNGAGKTTLIRLLLDLIRPSAGSARLFGRDVRADGPALRRRVGYLAGDFAVPERQPVGEILDVLAKMRGGVAPGAVTALCERLRLDRDRIVHSLSKGNRQKLGLVQALMHEPDLLILDEPTAGLDPLLQREFLSLMREARAKGQTVFLSSHVLGEVQQVADRVAILRAGELVEYAEVESLAIRDATRVVLTFDAPVAIGAFARIDGLSDLVASGSTIEATLVGPADALLKAAARHRVLRIRAHEPDLEEVFLRYYAEEREP